MWAVLLSIVIGSMSWTVCGQNKKALKEEREQAVKKVIESEAYTIDVQTAFPRRGKMITLTSPYSIEIRNDSVFSYLPYYGRAYSVPYGGGDGLIFNAPISQYKMVSNKRGAIKVEFITRSKEDRLRYYLTIFLNGSASIDVIMVNRDGISFSGDVKLPE